MKTDNRLVFLMIKIKKSKLKFLEGEDLYLAQNCFNKM